MLSLTHRWQLPIHGMNVHNFSQIINLEIATSLDERKSKETHDQTRGLSNLEMKHVGKLAIIGALLKAVFMTK